MSKEKDYAYFSEALHSSYLFYTMEVDKLNKENKLLREALEKSYKIFDECILECDSARTQQTLESAIHKLASNGFDVTKQALGE